MAEYVSIGLEQSFPEILAGMFEDFQTRVPGWVPYSGAPEVVLMEVIALRHTVRLEADATVVAKIFAYFGASVAGVPPEEATQATVEATVTINSEYPEAHEIPAGLRVTLPALEPEQEPVPFEVAETVDVAADAETATVTLIAQEAGAEGSGLSGPVTLLDGRVWIQEITLEGETAGGRDEEGEAEYRNRLVAKERRDSPTIITAVDAQEAMLEVPGVGRCLVLDNYVPAKEGEAAKEGVPGAFTAVVSAAGGANVSSKTKEECLAVVSLDGERLLDIQGYIIDPTRTGVVIAYSFDVFPGWDPEAVEAAADAAIAAYLSDATWGLVSGAAGVNDWEEELLVRYSEIYGVLNNVQGLNHALAVSINGHADTNAELAGPGALPTITSITGTYVA